MTQRARKAVRQLITELGARRRAGAPLPSATIPGGLLGGLSGRRLSPRQSGSREQDTLFPAQPLHGGGCLLAHFISGAHWKPSSQLENTATPFLCRLRLAQDRVPLLSYST